MDKDIILKCTLCGCTKLEGFDFSGPTDSGFFDANKLHSGKLYSYVCTECGHVELFLGKKPDSKK